MATAVRLPTQEPQETWRVPAIKALAEHGDAALLELAERIQDDLYKAVEKACGCTREKFEHAYSLVAASGYFGPFETNPDDPSDPMTVAQAEEILHKAAQGTRLGDYDYRDVYLDGADACPYCGHPGIFPTDDNYSSYRCQSFGCKKEFEEPAARDNCTIEGRTIVQELFATYNKIY